MLFITNEQLLNKIGTINDKNSLEILWSKLYLNEKRYPINNNLMDKLENLETKPIYYIDSNLHLSFTKNIGNLTNKKIFSQAEIIQILEYIISSTIKSFIPNANDYIDYSLLNMCINITTYILINFGNKFNSVDMYPLNINNIFKTKIGHQFVIAIFPTENGDKAYIIDPTYRQFCLLSYCNKNRLYHYDPYIMPGYFVKDLKPILFLLKNGYLEINEYTAKIYCDSFILSEESYLKREIITESNYNGKQYIKAFETGVI